MMRGYDARRCRKQGKQEERKQELRPIAPDVLGPHAPHDPVGAFVVRACQFRISDRSSFCSMSCARAGGVSPVPQVAQPLSDVKWPSPSGKPKQTIGLTQCSRASRPLKRKAGSKKRPPRGPFKPLSRVRKSGFPGFAIKHGANVYRERPQSLANVYGERQALLCRREPPNKHEICFHVLQGPRCSQGMSARTASSRTRYADGSCAGSVLPRSLPSHCGDGSKCASVRTPHTPTAPRLPAAGIRPIPGNRCGDGSNSESAPRGGCPNRRSSRRSSNGNDKPAGPHGPPGLARRGRRAPAGQLEPEG